MPIQIDRMDTTVEITGRSAEGAGAAPERAPAIGGAAAPVALRELVMQIFADELERFTRMRGLP